MRQEVYRVAYDEASAELSEIVGRFEQLRVRKDRVEKVVEALKPLVTAVEGAAAPERVSAPVERQPVAVEAPTHAPEPVQSSAPSHIPYPVQQPASDPFGRREPAGTKDVSEYSRLFNTGVSRGN
jgi:uncharacterized membrane protein